ncbi:hypothetical protein ACFXJ8_11680 [Nonomuraea sp. NPDC059194]|uniref:hypothetical protein n=1 Tax=Nonomuraea sp. NPDC059194 TaxID=3346764 RepID=UPI0036A63E4D
MEGQLVGDLGPQETRWSVCSARSVIWRLSACARARSASQAAKSAAHCPARAVGPGELGVQLAQVVHTQGG